MPETQQDQIRALKRFNVDEDCPVNDDLCSFCQTYISVSVRMCRVCAGYLVPRALYLATGKLQVLSEQPVVDCGYFVSSHNYLYYCYFFFPLTDSWLQL
uniref:Hda101 n=1 Tax=Arundo donax TaxID=35708 RepID=A0A0A9EN19_ARUDO